MTELWMLELRDKQTASKLAGGVIQCDGCLLHFKQDQVTNVCECGAFLCATCLSAGKTFSCFCRC